MQSDDTTTRATRRRASVNGSLPASSVETLLKKWKEDMADWRESEEAWGKCAKNEGNIVRMNCCRVRARTLETVISDLRAEMEAASVRQPEENASMTDR